MIEFRKAGFPPITPLLSLTIIFATAAVEAGSIHGKVTDPGGKPLPGAMVSLGSNTGITESVYADQDGHFLLNTDLDGSLRLRVRKRYYHDDWRDLPLQADSNIALDARLAPLTDPQELSDDSPSLSHFAMIDFDKDEKAPFSRANFTRDCLTCHSLGNSFTRWQRPAEAWLPTVQRMHGYLGNTDQQEIRQRAELLAAAFDGRLATSRPEEPYDPLLARATVHQWRLDGSVVPHDAEYAPGSGKIYSSEMFGGELLETDLATGVTRHFKLPADGEPPGGAFTRMGAPAPYGLTVPRAPHSLVVAHDGKIYMTDSIGAAITSFDPKTGDFANYPVGNGAVYPHTVREDAAGVIWFTIAFSNQVGRFDPATGDMKVITLPDTPSLSMPVTTIPYGVAVNPLDGGIWYAKLASDKIGHIDPRTLKVTEYDSPVRAPRRQRFDKDGNLWVAGFSDGAIAKINVADWQVKIYPLPVFAEGEIPAPYALAVQPVTGEVWVNDTMLDLVWRFLPDEERFVAYPMPLHGTYTRDFTFTPEGWACTSNNPIPSAALEGGVPELICIDPGDTAPAQAGI